MRSMDSGPESGSTAGGIREEAASVRVTSERRGCPGSSWRECVQGPTL